MANGSPVTFGGGFAQGFAGGSAAAANILNTVRGFEEINLRRAEARRESGRLALEHAVKALEGIQGQIGQAVEAGQPQIFGEGTAHRETAERALEVLRAAAEQAGVDPAIADAARTELFAQLEIESSFKAASPAGKIVQDRQALVGRHGEGSEFVKSFDRLAAENVPTETVQRELPDGRVVDLLINKQTGETIAKIGEDIGLGAPGARVEVRPTELPATKQQEIAERSDLLAQGVELVDQALALPKGSFGATATVSRGLREVMRIGGELTQAGVPNELAAPLKGLADLGEKMIDRAINEGRLDPDTAAELLRSDLTEAAILETRLAFLVANALQPSGKLLKDSINSAREIVNLSGLLTSEKTARERLNTVRNILRRSRAGLSGSAESIKEKPSSKRGEVKRRLTYDPATDDLRPKESAP